MYKVVEKFVSINGEGQKSGELAVFIRLAGCNLSCSYCDTMWANEENVNFDLMDKESIYDYIKSTGVHNVTLTGGEPLLAEEVKALIDFILKDQSLTLEIETNGSVDLKPFRTDENDLSFTLDYKSPSSLMNDHMITDNYKYLKSHDTVKFVVGSMEDLSKAYKIIRKYDLIALCKVYLSPIFGSLDVKLIVDFMMTEHLNGVRLQLQMHKMIWEPNEKGV